MTLSTVSWTPPAQAGTDFVGGAGWADLPDGFLLETGVTTSAFVFDAGVIQGFRFVTVGGQQRRLDGPVIASMNLQLVASRTGAAVVSVVEMGFVPETAAVDYSNAALPWARGEISLGSFNLGVLALFPAVSTVNLAPSGLLTTEVRARVTSRVAWAGRLAISLRLLSGSALAIASAGQPAPVMSTTQELFFAGLAGGPASKVRAVRDGRFAMPAMATDLVRDGDQPGMFVRAFDFDPEDEEATYRPRPGEGTVDDDVSNL